MMNTRKAILLLAVILSALIFAIPTASKSNDHIIINNADEVTETSVSMTQDLMDSLAGVGPRIVLQYANQLRPVGLVAIPSSLQTLLDQVSDRIIVQYANAIRQDDLAAVPSALQTLLGQVSDRIIFQYANANREVQLVYPAALINDATRPQISDITASMTGSDSATVTWTTDEFANSEVIYGTQPGVYPQTVSDPLYTKQHEITLTELALGATYYYKVLSTDRSGNTTTSSEHGLSAQFYVYLPFIVHNKR
ncbi:MAG: fibronectin type III domain-containing protein [Chloroflexi bacterium]|nr:fibronectin type III domain-containing protein [Chloroflexota bacterium]